MTFPSGLSLHELNNFSQNTLVSHIGIEFIEIGENFLRARMPVDSRTIQPMGLLHGGASVVLAETLGSVAANLIVQDQNKACVGLEINANHIRSVKKGWVVGTVSPMHIGKSTHVWTIEINNEAQQLVCISRLTVSILDKKG